MISLYLDLFDFVEGLRTNSDYSKVLKKLSQYDEYKKYRQFTLESTYHPGQNHKAELRDDTVIQAAIDYLEFKAREVASGAIFFSDKITVCGTLFIPPGYYRLAQPLRLPRGYMTVHLTGTGMNHTILYASIRKIEDPLSLQLPAGEKKRSFPDGRAIIEWKDEMLVLVTKKEPGTNKTVTEEKVVKIDYKKARPGDRYHRIRDLFFVLPENAVRGVRAIHYKVWDQGNKYIKHIISSGTPNMELEKSRLKIEISNIQIRYTAPLCAESLIKLEGPVHKSRIENVWVHGGLPGGPHPRQCFVYTILDGQDYTIVFNIEARRIILIEADDRVLLYDDKKWYLTSDAHAMKAWHTLTNEGTGLWGCIVRNLNSPGTLFRGRALWTTIEDCNTDGGNKDPYLELRNSFRVTLRNICTEGRYEDAQIWFDTCLDIRAEDVSLSSPDAAYFAGSNLKYSRETLDEIDGRGVECMFRIRNILKLHPLGLAEIEGVEPTYYSQNNCPQNTIIPLSFRISKGLRYSVSGEEELRILTELERHKYIEGRGQKAVNAENSIGLRLTRSAMIYFRTTPVVLGVPRVKKAVDADALSSDADAQNQFVIDGRYSDQGKLQRLRSLLTQYY